MPVWKTLRYFSRRENWGKPDLVDPKLLLILDAYRHELQVPLYVSKGVSPPGSHDAQDSAHYIDEKTGYASAVDLIPLLSQCSALTLLDCYLLATKYPFSGIGIYPHWRLSKIAGSGKIVERGGLHLDTKTRNNLSPFRAAGHWIGIPGKGYKQQYMGVSKWNLRQCGII